jgi:hypothetical protein
MNIGLDVHGMNDVGMPAMMGETISGFRQRDGLRQCERSAAPALSKPCDFNTEMKSARRAPLSQIRLRSGVILAA